MKRLPVFSAAALLAPALFAQVGALPANLSIAAPQGFVVAARSLPLSVRAVNARGAILRDRSFDWRVSDPTRARIDENGVLFGLSPGAVDVTVTDRDSGASGTRRYNVHPASISLDPADASLQIGEKRKLAAIARDADGKILSGVPFQWLSELPGIAAVDPEGNVSGLAEGRVTVSAAVDLGPEYSRFSAYIAVRVLRRQGYKVKSIVSSVAAAAATTTAPTRVSAAGNYAAALTSLSNGGQAALLWQGGRVQTLVTTGSALNGRTIASLNSITVNSKGDVVVFANVQNEWCEHLLALFPNGARSPTILDDTTRCSYWNLTPNSFGAQQNLVYRYSNTLYLRKPDGTRQALLNIGDRPGVVDLVNNINDWSITPSGKILVEIQDSSFTNTYLAWDGAKFQKLFAFGDRIQGTFRISSANLPVETAPDEYFTVIGGSDWSAAGRLKQGDWRVVAQSGKDTIGWVHGGRFGGADGAGFFFADQNGKTKLFRNIATANEVLGTYAAWRELNTVAGLAGGDALAFGTLDGPVPKAVRFIGTSTSAVFESGLLVDGAAPGIAQSSIPKAINPAGAYLRTSGDTLLRVTPSGASVFLKPGDALPKGALGQLGAVSANRLGDLVFTATRGSIWALYSLRAGQLQSIADSENDRLGQSSAILYGFTGSDNQVAMNNAGRIVALTWNNLANGLFLYSGPNSASAARVVALQNDAIPGVPGRISGFNSVAIDEQDRVAFVANMTTGKTALFIWDQGRIQQVLEIGQKDPNGRAYQWVQNLQAAGSRFYLRAAVDGRNEHLAVEGTAVRILAIDNSATTFGAVISNLFGAELTANSRGDIVFPILTPSGPMLILRRADGTDVPIAASDTRGPDGEWFLNLYGAGIGEQGDVIFSTDVWSAGSVRLALYQATPN
ncbi:MAG TPA: Ig-like domain-containing protein [Gemmataceae bacterium]|nr:Ig-like domain-containing protein [Gemmataceae bacterium]